MHTQCHYYFFLFQRWSIVLVRHLNHICRLIRHAKIHCCSSNQLQKEKGSYSIVFFLRFLHEYSATYESIFMGMGYEFIYYYYRSFFFGR